MSERKRLGQRLVEAGLLTPDQLQAALEYQKANGGRLGEVLLVNGFIGEPSLLRFLAAEYKTRYVSTDKLAKVKLPSAILDKIPVRMAEQAVVMPILWDEGRGTLSVVMAEPQNLQLIEEIRLISESQQVQAYIASRSAILAAVRKHYYGDISAFADVESAAPKVRDDVRGLVDYYEHARTGVSELRVPTETSPDIRPTQIGAPTSVRAALDELRNASLTSDNDFIETLNILVGLLELTQPDRKGHSASVAKLTRSLSKRLGLAERDTNHNIIAAYLHDLGKRTERHLTAMTIAEDPDARKEAARTYRTPVRLFETVHLPVEVNRILAQLYEAWDGTGVPDGARGTEIVLGARILAAVDAYEDLTRIPAPGADAPLSRDLAVSELTAYAGTLLDPQLVEILRQVVTGDLMRQRLLADGQHIVLADPDPESTALLELKLTEKGYVVSVARDASVALHLLQDGADLLLTETQLRGGESGFELLGALRQETWGRDVPVIFLTHDANPDSVERGLGLGAADYVVKPYAVEVFLAKIRRILESTASRSARSKTVRGSLDEMPLGDVLTILSEAGRSGRLQVQGRRRSGEVALDQGRVVHATFGEVQGEEAFTGLLSIRSGEFRFEPDAEVPTRTLDLAVGEVIGRAAQKR